MYDPNIKQNMRELISFFYLGTLVHASILKMLRRDLVIATVIFSSDNYVMPTLAIISTQIIPQRVDTTSVSEERKFWSV